MHLGKLCKYTSVCTVYKNENNRIDKPIFIIKNVFCNRGHKGWSNCKRFLLYEQEERVKDSTTPND